MMFPFVRLAAGGRWPFGPRGRRGATLGLTAWALLGGTVLCGRAAEPSLPSSWLAPSHYYSLLRPSVPGLRTPEIGEMLTAIAHGSEMGPGEGWFHPGQSRYGWEWLAGRYDADHDGSITRQEFPGPSPLFDRLDRNHDGVLTRSDFDWSDHSLYALQGMPSRFWFRRIDTNSNGRISREEWQAFFARIARGKDYLTPDDLREAFPVAPPPRKPGAAPQPEGPSPVLLALGLLTGELGSFFEGPAVGQRAPDFTLRTVDGKRQVRLADYRGKKPVVLVFGSFT